MERAWTTVGEEYVERLGLAEVEAAIDGLEWQDVPVNGKLTVGFMPGEAINTCIREFAMPKVSKIAIDAFERPAASPEEDGFYPGFYGIEANYANGRVRVYVLDTGCGITPLASDFWEKEVMMA